MEIFVLEVNSIEKESKSIREIKIWTNSKDKKTFIQALKKLSEEFEIKLKKANGLNNINIWIYC